MEKRGYQPSRKEIKKAEENLTKTQKVMTDHREKAYKSFDEKTPKWRILRGEGKTGELDLAGKKNWEVELDGHKIKFDSKLDGTGKDVFVDNLQINGIKFNADQSKRFFKKYKGVMQIILDERYDMKKIESELKESEKAFEGNEEEEKAEKILKDLGV